MDSLADFTRDTTQLHVMGVEYEERFGETVVHLFCRNRDDEHVWVEVTGHSPSFYIPREAATRKIANHQWVTNIEDGYQSIHQDPLARIETKLPKHIDGDRNTKGLREYFDTTYEADVFYDTRFLIDTGIKTHFEYNKADVTHGQHISGDFQLDVSDIRAVDDPTWRATPRVVTIDIEVLSPDGFPEPDEANQPVTAITAYDNYADEYTVWVRRCESWTQTDTEISNMAIEERPAGSTINEVRVFDAADEDQMLDSFNRYVEDKRPDLLSGWNSSATDMGGAFDYPYLINRCQSLNVLSFREWSPMGQVWDGSWGPSGKGVEMFDMMKAYKKTQFSKPNGGYGLENIASKELDYGKEDIDDIDEAYVEDPRTFLTYNMRDVSAVVGIDDSAEVIDLFQNIRALAGVQFENCHNPIDTLDPYIIRFANQNGFALPTNEKPERGWFYGGHVFEPELGRHPNAVYPDVWSEYPNAFRVCNISPETAVGTKADLEASEYTEDDCRWSYIDTRQDNVKKEDDPDYEKFYYLKPEIKEGFMSQVVDHVMGLKDAYDGTPLYGPAKIIVNATWGVFGDSDSYGKGYRLFDWRLAESITLYGRKTIQYTASKYVDALNDLKDEHGYEGRNAYQVGGDTDSVMTSIPFMDADTRADQAQIVDLAIEACDIVNDSYDDFADEMFNSDGEYMELEIESYAPWLFVPKGVTKEKAKKRYAEIIAWDEGDWYDPPEFSVTGIDIVRSDRADVTRSVLEDVITTILREDDKEVARNKVYETIKSKVDAIKNGEIANSEIARPKGMSKEPTEYGSVDDTPMPTYRGAKYANQHFEWENLGEGSKPQLLYIDRVRGEYPSSYTAETKEDGRTVDAIACEQPDAVPDAFVVDTSKMVTKVLEDPLTPILEAMGWSFDEALSDSTQVGIESFM